ncbi:isoprenyl transferase [Nitrospirota bacterium]
MEEKSKIPAHVGIIMDGNGRWAKLRGLPRVEGHRRGAEKAKEIIRAASDMGIKAITLYTFSMENWQRPPSEVSLLMKLLEYYLDKELSELIKEGVRFRAIGETWLLPDYIRNLIERAEERTRDNTGLLLITALSYGGRNEILRAVKRAIKEGIDPESLTEDSFSALLDTSGIPHPDLIIRTSGEIRLSNFLLWQAAYAELYFTETLWPDFSKEEFQKAVDSYSHRDRRFGAVSSGESK